MYTVHCTVTNTVQRSHLWVNADAAAGGAALRLCRPRVRAGGGLVPQRLRASGRADAPVERCAIARPLGAARLHSRQAVCSLLIRVVQ